MLFSIVNESFKLESDRVLLVNLLPCCIAARGRETKKEMKKTETKRFLFKKYISINKQLIFIEEYLTYHRNEYYILIKIKTAKTLLNSFTTFLMIFLNKRTDKMICQIRLFVFLKIVFFGVFYLKEDYKFH